MLIGSAPGKRLAVDMPSKDECVVPTIVQLQLSKGLRREADEERVDRTLAYTQKCIVGALDPPIALLAAELHVRHQPATADAIGFAALLDRHLHGGFASLAPISRQ